MRWLLGSFAAVCLVTAGGAAHASPQGACTAQATKALVHAFVRHYDGGRAAAAARLFAPKPRFQWFSTGKPGERLGPVAYIRRTLGSYFRSRVRAHERLVLIRLDAGYDPTRRIVNFGGKLLRSADDLRQPRRKDFKGAADCVSGYPTLILWSM